MGRYAHQPIHVLQKMPITQLREYANHVAKLLEDEADAVKPNTDS